MLDNRFVLAIVAIVASAPCQAAMCDSAALSAADGLSVVAPEMEFPAFAGSGHVCISA